MQLQSSQSSRPSQSVRAAAPTRTSPPPPQQQQQQHLNPTSMAALTELFIGSAWTPSQLAWVLQQSEGDVNRACDRILQHNDGESPEVILQKMATLEGQEVGAVPSPPVTAATAATAAAVDGSSGGDTVIWCWKEMVDSRNGDSNSNGSMRENGGGMDLLLDVNPTTYETANHHQHHHHYPIKNEGMDEEGWIRYSPYEAQELEVSYQLQEHECTMVISSQQKQQQCRINFRTMLQTNMVTGNQRRIRRIDLSNRKHNPPVSQQSSQLPSLPGHQRQGVGHPPPAETAVATHRMQHPPRLNGYSHPHSPINQNTYAQSQHTHVPSQQLSPFAAQRQQQQQQQPLRQKPTGSVPRASSQYPVAPCSPRIQKQQRQQQNYSPRKHPIPGMVPQNHIRYQHPHSPQANAIPKHERTGHMPISSKSPHWQAQAQTQTPQTQYRSATTPTSFIAQIPFHGDISKGQLQFAAGTRIVIDTSRPEVNGWRIGQIPTSTSTGIHGKMQNGSGQQIKQGWFPVALIQTARPKLPENPPPGPNSFSNTAMAATQHGGLQSTSLNDQNMQKPVQQQQQQKEKSLTTIPNRNLSTMDNILNLYGDSSNKFSGNTIAPATTTHTTTNTMQQAQHAHSMKSTEISSITSKPTIPKAELNRSVTDMPPNEMTNTLSTSERALNAVEEEIRQLDSERKSLETIVLGEMITRICCKLDEINIDGANDLRLRRKELIRYAESLDKPEGEITVMKNEVNVETKPNTVTEQGQDAMASKTLVKEKEKAIPSVPVMKALNSESKNPFDIFDSLLEHAETPKEKTMSQSVPPPSFLKETSKDSPLDMPTLDHRPSSDVESLATAIREVKEDATTPLGMHGKSPDGTPVPHSSAKMTTTTTTTLNSNHASIQREETIRSDTLQVAEVDDLLTFEPLQKPCETSENQYIPPSKPVLKSSSENDIDLLSGPIFTGAPHVRERALSGGDKAPIEALATGTTDFFATQGNHIMQPDLPFGISLPPSISSTPAENSELPITSIAQYQFEGDTSQDQLSFPPGAKIQIVPNMIRDGWAFGIFNGHKGWFPASYVSGTLMDHTPMVYHQDVEDDTLSQDSSGFGVMGGDASNTSLWQRNPALTNEPGKKVKQKQKQKTKNGKKVKKKKKINDVSTNDTEGKKSKLKEIDVDKLPVNAKTGKKSKINRQVPKDQSKAKIETNKSGRKVGQAPKDDALNDKKKTMAKKAAMFLKGNKKATSSLDEITTPQRKKDKQSRNGTSVETTEKKIEKKKNIKGKRTKKLV